MSLEPKIASLNGPLMTHLTPHDFLRQSLGQRQRLAANLAVRQCLIEALDTSWGDLGLHPVQPEVTLAADRYGVEHTRI